MRRGQSRDEAEAGDSAPWLDEAAYEDEGPIHTLIGTRIFVVLIVTVILLTIGIAVGVSLVSQRSDLPIDIPPTSAEAPVLTTPGDWKVKPSGPDADGIPVEGQGQTLYGTSEGRSTDARIALDALPEDPLPRPGSAEADEIASEVTEIFRETPAASPEATKSAEKAEKSAGPKVIRPPEAQDATTPAAPTAAPTGLVQLGAFSSEGRARTAFKALSERFSYLQGLEPLIIPVAQDGKTLYRLRARVTDKGQARDICGRLSVAGEACSVVNQN